MYEHIVVQIGGLRFSSLGLSSGGCGALRFMSVLVLCFSLCWSAGGGVSVSGAWPVIQGLHKVKVQEGRNTFDQRIGRSKAASSLLLPVPGTSKLDP